MAGYEESIFVVFSPESLPINFTAEESGCDPGPPLNFAVTQTLTVAGGARVQRQVRQRLSATRPALLPNQAPYTPALPLGRGADKRKAGFKASRLVSTQV